MLQLSSKMNNFLKNKTNSLNKKVLDWDLHLMKGLKTAKIYKNKQTLKEEM